MCGLAFLQPQIALADGDKRIEVCNNFTSPSKSIWLTLGSNKTAPEGTVNAPSENRWLKGLEIRGGECKESSISKDNWGGGRAYIFDREPHSDNDYNSDGNFQLVEFTFLGKEGDKKHGTSGSGVGYNFSGVDSVSSAIPLAVEATFTDKAKAQTNSYAYTGNLMTSQTNQNNAVLDAEFAKLVDAGWPYYKNSSHDGHYKIPGGFNALSANQQVGMWTYKDGVKQKITPEALVTRWKNWVDLSSPGYINCAQPPQSPNANDPKYTKQFCEEFQQTAKMVWAAFEADRKKNLAHPSTSKQRWDAFQPSLNTDIAIAQHITGYAIFNEAYVRPANLAVGVKDPNLPNFDDLDAKQIGRKWTHLAQGLPNPKGELDLEPKYLKYRYPDYNSPYNLDPYVTAVHKHFDMNVYAFSINDEVGYFQTPDEKNYDKLIIAVGGLKGLPNQTQFQPKIKSKYNVGMGNGWDSIEACGRKTTYPFNPKADAPREPLTFIHSDSCEVKALGTVTDDKGKRSMIELSFKAKLDNDGKLQKPAECVHTVDGKIVAADKSACINLILDTNTGIDIAGPSPRL